jgi:hypothetical protein
LPPSVLPDEAILGAGRPSSSSSTSSVAGTSATVRLAEDGAVDAVPCCFSPRPWATKLTPRPSS